MKTEAYDDVNVSTGKPVVMFIARGHPGNRWYEGADGKFVLKDEYKTS